MMPTSSVGLVLDDTSGHPTRYAALPEPWTLHGTSLGLPNMALNSDRFTASSDSRMDSSAGSKVSPASRMTTTAIANGQARSE